MSPKCTKKSPFSGRAAAAYEAAKAICDGHSIAGREAWALAFRRLAWELNVRRKGNAPDMSPFDARQIDAVKTFAGALFAELQEDPHDLAGEIYMGLKLNDTGHEQVFTPNEAARFIVASSMDKADTMGIAAPTEVLDPFCGSGCLALAQLAERKSRGLPPSSLWMVMADIDPLCCDMAFVQFTYAGGLGETHLCDTFRTTDIRNTPITHIDPTSDIVLSLFRRKAL